MRDIKEIESWLELQLKNTWSQRDIKILAEVLFEQYKNDRFEGKTNRYGREYLTKMLIKGKIQKGIPLDR